jgi:hypothetical protein
LIEPAIDFGERDAKDRRAKEAEMQELRRQRDLEKGKQGGEMSAVQWNRDQAVKSGSRKSGGQLKLWSALDQPVGALPRGPQPHDPEIPE